MRRAKLNYWLLFLIIGVSLAPGIGFGNIIEMGVRSHSSLLNVVPANAWTIMRVFLTIEWLIFSSLFVGLISLIVVTVPMTLLIGFFIKITVLKEKDTPEIELPSYAVALFLISMYCAGIFIGYCIGLCGITYPVI